MNCPVDSSELAQAGYTHACAKCKGAWVKSEALVPMLEERVNSLVELQWQPRPTDSVRVCPECGSAMETVMLGSVALDRCQPHGVWFDAGELTSALKQAKQFRAEPKPQESLLHKLGKLLAID